MNKKIFAGVMALSLMISGHCADVMQIRITNQMKTVHHQAAKMILQVQTMRKMNPLSRMLL